MVILTSSYCRTSHVCELQESRIPAKLFLLGKTNGNTLIFPYYLCAFLAIFGFRFSVSHFWCSSGTGVGWERGYEGEGEIAHHFSIGYGDCGHSFGSDLMGGSHVTNRRLVPVWGYHINCSVYMSCDLEGQGNITVVVVASGFIFLGGH
jgi:hypothetical protein